MSMQYLGGKSRIAKQLTEVIDSVRRPGQLVWDAFCGGLSMSVALRKKGPVWSTDANAALIALYRAVQSGWEPPTEVSKEQWQAAKSLPDTDPLKAFCGFGCSFGGMWFSGFAENYRERIVKRGPEIGKRKRQWTHKGSAETVVKAAKFGSFACVDFLSFKPRPFDGILYLDPPYAETTGYAGMAPFDSEAFVRRVREWAKYTHVFVSEYNLSIGECVWSRQMKTGQFAAGKAVERLYYVGPTSNLDGAP